MDKNLQIIKKRQYFEFNISIYTLIEKGRVMIERKHIVSIENRKSSENLINKIFSILDNLDDYVFSDLEKYRKFINFSMLQ